MSRRLGQSGAFMEVALSTPALAAIRNTARAGENRIFIKLRFPFWLSDSNSPVDRTAFLCEALTGSGPRSFPAPRGGAGFASGDENLGAAGITTNRKDDGQSRRLGSNRAR